MLSSEEGDRESAGSRMGGAEYRVANRRPTLTDSG